MTEKAGRTPVAVAGPPEVIVLSAPVPAALEALTDRLAEDLCRSPAPPLDEVAFALQTERPVFDHRRVVIGWTAADVSAALATRDPARVFTREAARGGRRVTFLCAGLGDQYVGMAHALYRHEPAFRAALDDCAALAAPHLGVDLRDVLYPPAQTFDCGAETGDFDLRAMVTRPVRGDVALLNQTRIAQPAVFAVGYAVARCLCEWGVEPSTVVGHSIGEYVAATVAGLFSLPDAMRIVCQRAALIDRLPAGAMLAVAAAADEVLALTGDLVDLAAVNGERAVVIAGTPDAVARAQARLTSRGVPCRLMETTHALHSRLMDGARAPFADLLRSVAVRPMTVPCVANLTGTWFTPDQAADPGYWTRHMCSTVRFADGLDCVLADVEAVLVEVGPGQTLGSFAKQHPRTTRERVSNILSSIPLAHVRQSAVAFFRTLLGRLWLAGVDVEWARGRGST